MKRRIVSILLVLCALLALLPTAAASETEVTYTVEGGNIYFDKSTGTITDCDNTVTSAVIPSEIGGVAVKAIGDSAFDSCRKLKSVMISYGIASIGENAFCGCSSLTDVLLPNSVTFLDSFAFQHCAALQSIFIPEEVKEIEVLAFYGCNSLKEIRVDEKNPYLSNDAAGALLNKEKTELLIVPCGLTQYVIPDSISIIEDHAFEGCCNLLNITIPNNVTKIGSGAFRECRSLAGIWVDGSNRYYCSDAFGVLFNREMTELIQAPSTIGGEYVIPDGVASIQDDAFNYCPDLSNVVIPDSVTSIGDQAFWGCSSLTAVTLPNSIMNIGYGIFAHCDNLKTVTIPASVTIIKEHAFLGCNDLTNVCFFGNAPSIDDSAFQSYNYLDGYCNISGMTFYYIEGKSGWTSPEWNGYPTATWDGVNYPKLPEPEETKPDSVTSDWSANEDIGGNLSEDFEGSYTVIFTPYAIDQRTEEIVYVETYYLTLAEKLKFKRTLLDEDTKLVLFVIVYSAPLIVVLWLLIFVIFGKRKFSCPVASVLLWVLLFCVSLRSWLLDGNCLIAYLFGLPLQLLLILLWILKGRREAKKEDAIAVEAEQYGSRRQDDLPARWPMNQPPTQLACPQQPNRQSVTPQTQWPMNQQSANPQQQINSRNP